MLGFSSLLGLLFFAWFPVFLAIYFFKSKPKEVKVASHFLWDQVLQKQNSKGWFETFRKNAFFWLQLLIFFLLFLLLSKPYWETKSQASEIIVILDTSASMQQVVDSISALELAKREITDLDRSIDSRVSEIITWDEAIQSFSNFHSLAGQLHQIRETNYKNSDSSLLVPLCKERIARGSSVILFSDALPVSTSLTLSNLGVQVIQLAKSARNLYFRDVRRESFGKEEKVRVKIARTGSISEGTLRIQSQGTLHFTTRVIFSGDEEELLLPIRTGSTLELSLLSPLKDDLAADNLWILPQKTSKPKVWLDPSLSSSADMLIQYFMMESRLDLVEKMEEADLRVFLESNLTEVVVNSLVISAAPSLQSLNQKVLHSYAILPTHRTIRYLQVGKLRPVNQGFVQSGEQWKGILASVLIGDRKTIVPLLEQHGKMQNCYRLNLNLSSQSLEALDNLILIENLVRIYTDSLSSKMSQEIKSDANQPSEPGLYDIDGEEKFFHISTSESRLSPGSDSQELLRNFKDQKMKPRRKELTTYILLLVVFFVCFEWWLFSRRM